MTYPSGWCPLETYLATAGSILRATRSPLEKGKKPDEIGKGSVITMLGSIAQPWDVTDLLPDLVTDAAGLELS